MEKSSSFLFAGIRFDRKKFASDFARLQKKEDSPPGVEPGPVELGEKAEELTRKKRKRKANVSGNFRLLLYSFYVVRGVG
ncbi:hypothetical protein ACLOJK_018669 [Asimina triloba]